MQQINEVTQLLFGYTLVFIIEMSAQHKLFASTDVKRQTDNITYAFFFICRGVKVSTRKPVQKWRGVH